MSKVLELAAKPVLVLKDGVRELTVEFPLSAVVDAEKRVGHSLKAVTDWLNLEWTEVSKVLHAGLAKCHPEITFEEIDKFCTELGAEGVLEIRHALTCLNFPKTMQRIADRLAGKKDPNVQGGAAN